MSRRLDNSVSCIKKSAGIRRAVLRFENGDADLALYFNGQRYHTVFPTTMSFTRIREELRRDGIIVVSGSWCFDGYTTWFDVLL